VGAVALAGLLATMLIGQLAQPAHDSRAAHGADPALGRTLRVAMSDLNSVLLAQRRTIGADATAKQRSAAARRIAAAYGAYARRTSTAPVRTREAGSVLQLTRAARGADGAYLALAGAHTDRQWQAARADVVKEEHEVERALGRLHALGYPA
jgi:hypothetical protein